jgi:hypothetical protein
MPRGFGYFRVIIEYPVQHLAPWQIQKLEKIKASFVQSWVSSTPIIFTAFLK